MKIKLLKRIKKKHPEFKETYETIVSSNYKYGWSNLVGILIKQESYKEAIGIANFLFDDIGEKQASEYTYMADVYEKCNDNASAIAIYERALDDNVINTTRIYLYYGKLAESYYKKEKVISIYKSFLVSKKSKNIHSNFIKYLFAQKEYKYSVEECLIALNKHKNKTSIIQLYLAKSYEKLNQLYNAKKVLVELTQVNLNNGKAWKILREIEERLFSLEQNSEKENIIRKIEFSPEHHSAGMSILQNFGKLLRDKYSEFPVKVTISQEDLRVKMIITPPDGKRVEVEEYLNKYGLVIKGEITPEEFVHEPLQLAELKGELMMARTRIEIQREQMLLLGNQHTSKIESLENQIGWLRSQVGNSLAIQNDNFNQLATIFKDSNENTQKLTNNLIKAIKKIVK